MLTRRMFVGSGACALFGCDSYELAQPEVARQLHPETRFFVPGYKTSALTAAATAGTGIGRNLPANYDGDVVLLSLIRADGSTDQALFPLRGHDVAISPDGRIGQINALEHETYATFDAQTLDLIAHGTPYKDGFFGGGHSAFVSNDVVAVCERAPKRGFTGAAESYHGFLTLRDPNSLKVLGGFSSFGISPHEVKLLEDGKHIAISNTGTIVPEGLDDYGIPRQVHDPALAIVEISSGKLVERIAGDPQRELRHIAPSKGTDVFAIQTELVAKTGVGTQLYSPDPVPTASVHQYNAAPVLAFLSPDRQPLELGSRFQQSQMIHGLSIEFDPDHDEVIATMPDVHRIMIFDAATGEVKHNIRTDRWGLYSPCGIALVPGQDFYVVAGYWEGLFVIERGTHGLRRELSHKPVNFGHSHIEAFAPSS